MIRRRQSVFQERIEERPAVQRSGIVRSGIVRSSIVWSSILWMATVAGVLAVSLGAADAAQAKGLGGLLGGLNGILTAPADPVRNAIFPPDDFDEVPLSAVSGRVLGILSGTLLAGYRAATGVIDVALTPLWVIPTLSPDPAIKLIPGSDKRD